MRARAWGVLLLAFGCGGPEKPGNPQTTGGQGTGGSAPSSAGTSVGSSGSGGVGGNLAGASGLGGFGGPGNAIGVVLGDTPAEACIGYAWAVCSRREECGANNPLNCTAATLECPDLTSSPGATRTAQVLKECAQTFAALPCDQVRADALPACVTPGTRMRGEACTFASQCAGLHCSNPTPCGTCGVRAGAGESCSELDVDCKPGTGCNSDTETCELPKPVVSTTPGANQACMPDFGCQGGYFCKADGLGGGTCTADAKVTESCAEAPCIFGAYCAPDLVCKAAPSLGQPCGLDQQARLLCDGSAVCKAAEDSKSGTCVAPPKAGEPCIGASSTPGSGYCRGAGLHCDHATTPPLCKTPGKAGEECASINDCAGLAACECDAGLPECPRKHCVELHITGQPCSAPNTRCHPAFECVSGICQPITLRGDFAQLCGL